MAAARSNNSNNNKMKAKNGHVTVYLPGTDDDDGLLAFAPIRCLQCTIAFQVTAIALSLSLVLVGGSAWFTDIEPAN